MKIYCAGSWKNRKDIKLTWINRLKQFGHEITHDWTETENERINKDGDQIRDIEYHRNCAILDLNGVKEAELLLVVMDSAVEYYSYRGTFTEIGAALMKGIPIVLYNPWTDSDDINEMLKYTRSVSNVFYWHPNITHVTTGNEAFRKVKEFSEKLKESS